MGRHTPSRVAALLLLAAGTLAGAEALAGDGRTGGDACSLVERLPGAGAPLRDQAPVRGAFRALDRAGSDARRMAKAYASLEEAVLELLETSRRVFATRAGADWGDEERLRAQRFLRKHVLERHPVLRIGDVGFEPTPGLRAALMWTACRGRDREAAIRWGRRATTSDEGPARAFAALLLLEAGRQEEARALLPTLTGDSFLVSWVKAELATDAAERRRHHERADKRTTTHDQNEAVRAQRERLEADGPDEPDEADPTEPEDHEGAP